jgi:hypothetical protein
MHFLSGFGMKSQGIFTIIKVYVVYLGLSLVFKAVFGIILAPLVCLKSVK